MVPPMLISAIGSLMATISTLKRPKTTLQSAYASLPSRTSSVPDRHEQRGQLLLVDSERSRIEPEGGDGGKSRRLNEIRAPRVC